MAGVSCDAAYVPDLVSARLRERCKSDPNTPVVLFPRILSKNAFEEPLPHLVGKTNKSSNFVPQKTILSQRSFSVTRNCRHPFPSTVLSHVHRSLQTRCRNNSNPVAIGRGSGRSPSSTPHGRSSPLLPASLGRRNWGFRGVCGCTYLALAAANLVIAPSGFPFLLGSTRARERYREIGVLQGPPYHVKGRPRPRRIP